MILPKDNEKDLADVPAEIQAELTVKFVEMMDEVLSLALERSLPAPAAPVEVSQEFSENLQQDQELTN